MHIIFKSVKTTTVIQWRSQTGGEVVNPATHTCVCGSVT